MPKEMRERIFWNYEKACEFCKEVNGRIEIRFLKCGQKDYVVRWYE